MTVEMTTEITTKTHDKDVKSLMEQAFIDYAMSVITDRALPDLRDGLKPVHRRILFSMHELGTEHNKPYKKSARIVGDVIGKYHPHGDTSVYGAAVRMAQPFAMNALLIDGQGNFGSIDGDSPAAMRYTEMRMTRLAGEAFADLRKETIGWIDNYDGSESEPEVLTMPFPNLLVNGVEGIAVGMATRIPPHNLADVCETTLALMDNSDMTTTEIVDLLKGPDFPTRGLIHGLDGFVSAIETGSGRVKIRAKWHEEERAKGGKSIIIDELPYQMNKATLQVKIAELVKEKKIEGITNLRDESNKDGIRVVIEVKRDESPEVVFSNLCTMTDLDDSFSYNCVVLDGGVPKRLGLKEIILKWIVFREDVVLKRHIFDRKNALARLHILNGFMAALSQLDEVIKAIRASDTPQAAKSALMALLQIDEPQAEAILSMRLQKLSGMELDSIREEHTEVTGRVEALTQIIESPDAIRNVIRTELRDIANRYGIPRQSEIANDLSSISSLDLIPMEDVIVVLTKNGYIKRMPTTALTAQNRGTRGKRSIEVGDDDEVSAIYEANTHDQIMVFDKAGQVYSCPCYKIPEASLTAKGRHIRNIIEGFDGEIAFIVRAPFEHEGLSLVIATSDGTVKKSSLEDYRNADRRGGIKGMALDGNLIVGVFIAKETDHMMMISSSGKAIRFELGSIREIGRTCQGLRGMKIDPDETVVGAQVMPADSTDMLVTIGEKGVGKKTAVSEFGVQNRAGQGMACFKMTPKTGALVSAFCANDEHDVIMLSSNGVSNRVHVQAIPETGRATSGVYLMNLDQGQSVVGVAAVIRQDEEVPEGEAGEAACEKS